MELVVDANIFLACFLKEGITRSLFLDGRLRLFTPDYFVSETNRHLDMDSSLRKRIRLPDKELRFLFEILTQRIIAISASAYAASMPEAALLAPETKDEPYLALALSMKIPIWSNDRGFKKQHRY